MGAPSSRSVRLTLWPCGTRSRSVRPEGNAVPAGRPFALTTIATLSRSWTWIYSGDSVISFLLPSSFDAARRVVPPCQVLFRHCRFERTASCAGPCDRERRSGGQRTHVRIALRRHNADHDRADDVEYRQYHKEWAVPDPGDQDAEYRGKSSGAEISHHTPQAGCGRHFVPPEDIRGHRIEPARQRLMGKATDAQESDRRIGAGDQTDAGRADHEQRTRHHDHFAGGQQGDVAILPTGCGFLEAGEFVRKPPQPWIFSWRHRIGSNPVFWK